MAEGQTKTETKRVAVVTGANKGIGLEICKQLASKGIVVVLTARNEKRGKEALHQNFKGSAAAIGGLSDLVVFHQLDVVDPASVASLADFVRTQFGKLDILVNNAGVGGYTVDKDALKASGLTNIDDPANSPVIEMLIETYKMALECLETNYYGTKRMVDAFIPLLQLSKSPRILIVSSTKGKLECISNEWAKGILSDAENLSEESVDNVVNEFLEDFNKDSLKGKEWCSFLPAYHVSKAALNSYMRILAKKYPDFWINSCCPGFVKTDINLGFGELSPEEGGTNIVNLLFLPHEGPSGLFFDRNVVSSF